MSPPLNSCYFLNTVEHHHRNFENKSFKKFPVMPNISGCSHKMVESCVLCFSQWKQVQEQNKSIKSSVQCDHSFSSLRVTFIDVNLLSDIWGSHCWILRPFFQFSLSSFLSSFLLSLFWFVPHWSLGSLNLTLTEALNFSCPKNVSCANLSKWIQSFTISLSVIANLWKRNQLNPVCYMFTQSSSFLLPETWFDSPSDFQNSFDFVSHFYQSPLKLSH